MAEFADKLAAKSRAFQRARLGSLPYNLLKSGQWEKYYQILTNFDFLSQKIHHPDFGVQALIEDYELIDSPEATTHPEYDPEKVKTLKRIQGALGLSAHILSKDKTQLVEQLWGRMQGFDVPEIQQLLSQAKHSKTTWLRPLTPSFSTPGGRLVCTLTGNSSSVDSIAVTPDGKRLISGSFDTALRIWDLEKREELFTLTGHRSRVNAVVVTPDGKRLISGSQDSILKVWSLTKGEELLTLTGHRSRVNALAVTPDGEWLISSSSDKTLKVWNLQKGEELFTLTGHRSKVNAVAVTPDGKRLISGSSDRTLKVWNLKTGETLFTLNGHSSKVNAVAVTPDGKRLISGSSDRTLKIWNLEAGEDLFHLTRHENSVNTVAITSDGKRVISTGIMHTFSLRSLILSLQKKLIEVEEHEIFETLLEQIFSWQKMFMSYSSSSKPTLKCWNLKTREEVFPFAITNRNYWVEAVAVTPDGNRLISVSSDDTLKLWSLETEEELLLLKLQSKRFYQVWRFIYSIYKTIQLLRGGIRNGNYICVIFLAFSIILNMIDIILDIIFKAIGASSRKIAVTPDGKQVISASNSGTLKVWNIQTGEEIFPLMGHSDSVNAVAVTPDGKQMISSSSDNTLKVWNLEPGDGVFTFIWNLITGRQLFTLTGHSNSVNAVAVTPDGKQVISASDDNTLKVWDLSSREVIANFTGHSNSVNAVAVTPDGKQVISVSDDNTLKVWDLSSRQVVASFTGESALNCCAVAPDGVTIVVGEASGGMHFLCLEGMEAKL